MLLGFVLPARLKSDCAPPSALHPEMNMTGPEVLAMRQRMGLTQVELAERLGVSDRTVQRYEEGGCPEVVARLLAKLAEEEA